MEGKKKDEDNFRKSPPALLVKNLPQNIDEDEILMFFEHKRRFGDVNIDSVKLDIENSMAIITFANENGKYLYYSVLYSL